MEQQQDVYPIQFSVGYPDRPLDWFSSFFRIIFIIPVAIVLAMVSAGSLDSGDVRLTAGLVGGALFSAPLVMILFRHKYPRWWFDWNVELLKFKNRVKAYFFLFRDEYPSTDEEQAVHLEIPYPDVELKLHRWLPLMKWILAIPHNILLFFLFIALVIAWFAILFTGGYPRDLFNFVVGTMRWGNRVLAYAFVLVTDRYPPFRFNP